MYCKRTLHVSLLLLLWALHEIKKKKFIISMRMKLLDYMARDAHSNDNFIPYVHERDHRGQLIRQSKPSGHLSPLIP